jgi:DNA-binding response OmpR family regulator
MAQLNCGPLQLRPGDATDLVEGHLVELTRKEALLLEHWLRAAGGSWSKDALIQGCGDGRRAVGDYALRAHMRNLHQKLSAAGCASNLIETVYGLGYRLNPTAVA